VLRPKKRFGQHFLRDRLVLARILKALAPKADDHLVEIGPGTGALTQLLLAHCRQLDAIEIDRELVALLTAKFKDAPNFTLYCANALSFDFTRLAAEGEQLKILGNLPYNISTPLLFHLFGQKPAIGEMLFMLQKEVVERLAAAPATRQYGRLSVMAQYHCRIEKLFTVGPESFYPPPKVSSSIVRLTPYPVPPVEVGDYACFQAVVAAAFGKRRKTLRNALKSLLPEAAIRACGVNPGARAEELPLSAFAALSQTLAACSVHPPGS
jgi:16S rRNA (adenine1518-N6/adenine1519-N6)-dimethyltransferase